MDDSGRLEAVSRVRSEVIAALHEYVPYAFLDDTKISPTALERHETVIRETMGTISDSSQWDARRLFEWWDERCPATQSFYADYFTSLEGAELEQDLFLDNIVAYFEKHHARIISAKDHVHKSIVAIDQLIQDGGQVTTAEAALQNANLAALQAICGKIMKSPEGGDSKVSSGMGDFEEAWNNLSADERRAVSRCFATLVRERNVFCRDALDNAMAYFE